MNAGVPSATAEGKNGEMKKKLHGYEFYESIGRPKYVIAPMVDQSELVSVRLSIVLPASHTHQSLVTRLWQAS